MARVSGHPSPFSVRVFLQFQCRMDSYERSSENNTCTKTKTYEMDYVIMYVVDPDTRQIRELMEYKAKL